MNADNSMQHELDNNQFSQRFIKLLIELSKQSEQLIKLTISQIKE